MGTDSPSVLFVNQHYHPDVAATGQNLTDLAETVASEGFDAGVLCGRGAYTGGAVDAPRAEVRNGVEIRRLAVPGLGRGTHAGRILDYAFFYVQVLALLLFGRRRDLVVLLTTPPLLCVAGALARAIRGQPYAIWSMDLHPDAEVAHGMLDPDSLTARLLHALNDWGYRRARFVVDLGPCMKERIASKGVAEERLKTIPVWSDGDEVRPVPRSENPLAEELDLGDRFVVMYSGNAGLAHRFEEVLGAAERLSGRSDTLFLFVGGGPRRPEIERFVEESSIENFAYLDYFPRERLAQSLSLADVHLLTLRREFAGIAVPGKLYGIMAAGRPVLMVGPRRSEPAMTINTEAVGAVVDPNEEVEATRRVVEQLEEWRRRPDRLRRMGERARDVFVRRFERSVVCDRWTELLRRECGGGGSV